MTMLGMSRWAGQGGSSRTIQRFFATVIPWGLLLWGFFRHPVYGPGDVDLVAGDDVIGTKAGTCTQGLDRCFARWYGTPVSGLACFTLALVSVQARRSLPMRVEQGGRSDAEKAASKAKAAAKTPKAQVPHVVRGVPRAVRTSTRHTSHAPQSAYGSKPW
jgi:putative transposase